MTAKQRAFVSVTAILALLIAVSSTWAKQHATTAVSTLRPIAQKRQFHYIGPATTTAYLAEIKSRINGAGGASPVGLAISAAAGRFGKADKNAREKYAAIIVQQRPLWLVNRSLLI